MRRLALGSLSDGQLQLWSTSTDQTTLYTCWKEFDPSDPVEAGWTPWVQFNPLLPSAFDLQSISDIAALQLPDGRLQLYLASMGMIFTSRKATIDKLAQWTDWSVFPPAPPLALAGRNFALTAAQIAYQCTQLFASVGNGGLWTSWQLFSLDNPNVDDWSGWEQFAALPNLQYPIESSALTGWGSLSSSYPLRTALFQYSGPSGGDEVYRFTLSAVAGSNWQQDGYPSLLDGQVTAIAAVQSSPNVLQAFFAETDKTGLGRIRTIQNPSPQANAAGWSGISDFQWNGNPIDCLAAGQLQDGTGQIFASSGADIQTCWSDLNSNWTAWQGFPLPPS